MSEAIGIRAILDTGQFDSGLSRYLSGINKAEGATRGAASGFSGFGSILPGLGGQFASLGQGVLNFGLIAGGAALAGVTALTAGLITLGVTGVNKAVDLDAQMATIAATMNTTKAAVGPLKDLILDLALDPKLTVTATQAADAIQLLAQNGVTMKEIMDGAAKSTVALANATGADFGTAANIASGLMKVFNIDAKDMGIAIDGITGVVNQSKFTIDDYGQAFAQAGGVAAGMGLSLQDFNTIIASSADNFNSGSDAGTSFKTMLQRMANPTDENRDLMERYGISLFDTDGKMRDMKEVVGQLHGAFEGLTEAQRAELAAQLGGADASRSVLALAKMNAEQFDTLSGSVNDVGQAFRAAATRVDSAKGAMAIFQGIIEAIQIQVGDKFLPLLRGMTVGFADLATKIGPKVVAFFGGVAGTITSLISRGSELFKVFGDKGIAGVFASLGIGGGALFFKELGTLFGLITGDAGTLATTIQTVLGGAFTWLATNLFPVLTTGIQFLIDHFTEFKGALFGIGAVLATGVFAALVAGLFSLLTPVNLIIAGAALLGAAWAGNWGDIQGKTAAAWAVVQPVMQQMAEWLQEKIPLAIQALASFWTGVLQPLMAAEVVFLTTIMFPALSGLWTWLQTNLPAAIQTLSTAIQGLSSFWSNTLLPAITAVVDFGQTVALPFWMALADLLSAVVGKAVQALTGLWQNVLLPALKSVWKFLSDSLSPAFETISEVVGDKVGPAFEGFIGIFPDFTGGMSKIIQLIKDATNFFNGLAQAVSNFQLPAVLTPGSPTPMELGLRGIADAVRLLQGQIDQLNTGLIHGSIGAARDDLEKFFDASGVESSKTDLALRNLNALFHQNADEILSATDRAAAFEAIIERQARNGFSFGFLTEGGGPDILSDAVKTFVSAFDKALGTNQEKIKQLKEELRQLQIQETTATITTANSLIDLAQSSANRLSTQVDTLAALLNTGATEVMFEGQLISAAQAQDMLNGAMQEQVSIQDDLLALQQAQSQLGFLQTQLDLINQLNAAGLDATSILGDLNLGANASMADIVEASNRAIQALIGQAEMGLSGLGGIVGSQPAGTGTPVTGSQPITNRSVNISFPNMTIANGMDANNLVALIERTAAGLA